MQKGNASKKNLDSTLQCYLTNLLGILLLLPYYLNETAKY